jgi:hypothetical protein
MSDADIIANEQYFEEHNSLGASAAAFPVTLNVRDLT